MYASVQTRLDNLRAQALSHQYTKYALERIEEYKIRVQHLRESTQADLAARRETLVAKIQGQRDATVSALRERRDAVVTGVRTKVDEKKGQVKGVIGAQRDRAANVVRTTRDTVRDAVVVRKNQVIERSRNGVETILSLLVIVVANVLNVFIKVFFVLREAAPAKLVSSTEAGVATVKPHAQKAIDKAEQIDTAYFGGHVTAATTTVSTRVYERLEFPEPKADNRTPATEAATVAH
jgi:hypothetical protein